MKMTVGSIDFEVRLVNGAVEASDVAQVVKSGVMTVPAHWPRRRQARTVFRAVLQIIRRINAEGDLSVEAELLLRWLELNYGFRLFEPLSGVERLLGRPSR